MLAAYVGGDRTVLTLSGNVYLNKATVDQALQELLARAYMQKMGLDQLSKAEMLLISFLENYIPIFSEEQQKHENSVL